MDRLSFPPPLVAWLVLGLALVVAAVGMAQTFGQPFEREWLGRNGSRYAHIARNYERDGLMALRGAPRLDVVGRADGAEPEIYAHHPPGVSMAIAVATRLHGTDDEPHAREDATRLVPAVSTLLMLVILGCLTFAAFLRSHLDRRAAFWGAAMAVGSTAAMPMTNVYGAHADPQGPPVLAASLLVVFAYDRWLRMPGRGRALGVVAATVFASWFDWYGLYAPVLCALHLAITQPQRRRSAMALIAFTLALFVAWVTWVVTLPTMSLERFAEAIGLRASVAGGGAAGAYLDQLATWYDDFSMLVPRAWLFLMFLPALFLLPAPVSDGPDESARTAGLRVRGLAALLLLPPTIHGLLFSSGLVIHDYWLFGIAPAFGVVAAWAFQRVPWGATLVLLVAYFIVGGLRIPAVLDQSANPVPAMIGKALNDRTAPGDVVLTSYATNPFSSRPEGYTMMEPAITFYADRVVRGAITGLEAGGVQQRNWPAARAWADEQAGPTGSVWFLLDAWTTEPSDALRAAVLSATLGEPVQLDPTVDVWLHRLSPVDR